MKNKTKVLTNREMPVYLSMALILLPAPVYGSVAIAHHLLKKLNLAGVVTVITNTHADHFTDADPKKRNPLTKSTAAITRNPDNSSHPYTIIINTDWFSTLSDDEKQFWVGHEIMHLFLNHLNRIDLDAKQEERDADIAAACLLNCVDGSLSGMGKIKNGFTFEEKHLGTHPTFDERIAYLTELAQRTKEWPGDRMGLLKQYYPDIWKDINHGCARWQTIL